MNHLRRGDAVMASTKARSIGERMSLATCMANNTMARPARTTTDVTTDVAGAEDVSEFMTDLHKLAYGFVYSFPYFLAS